MALRHDIRHRRGDTFVSKTFAAMINGQPVDLVTWEVSALLVGPGLSYAWPAPQIHVGAVTFDYNGTTITAPTVHLEASAAVTQEWPVGIARWQMKITNSGEVHTLVEGTFRITKDVEQPDD